jgi:4-amino-4-deoxy-L-arabinose transferase-like glycosyltransferase
VLRLRWRLAVVAFLIGLGMRTIVFIGDHAEGDELIYMNLVSQLDQGHGYTLRDSALLHQGLIDRSQYDQPLFFHPPAAIALDWLFYSIVGIYGFPFMQIFSYAVFFWSMMLLGDTLRILSSDIGLATTAGLSAFSPIMAHVTTKFWLDGPLLAFTTLAIAIFGWALVHNKTGWTLISGMVMGLASLIKVVAFLAAPGALLVGWLVLKGRLTKAKNRRSKVFPLFVASALLFFVPALLVQLPWEIWQWVVCGSPFPVWAGKPSASLVASNNYVHYLTIDRPPWVYLTLTPRILWTLIPAGGLFALVWKRNSDRFLGFALITWMVVIVMFHVLMGYWGYSKVLRYIILITPASVLMCAQLLSEAIKQISEGVFGTGMGRVAVAMVAISIVAVFAEMATGVNVTLAYKSDLILPLLGKFY